MPRITKNTGRMYQTTSFYNGGRRAGDGCWHDDYSETSGNPCYENVWDRVRFPNDGVKPEDLNGPVICYKAGERRAEDGK